MSHENTKIPSNYRFKLWAEKELHYLIFSVGKKVSFSPTKEEALKDIKQIPGYKHATLWAASGDGNIENYMVIDMVDYSPVVTSSNPKDILKSMNIFPFSRIYQQVKVD